jgi:8-oxo-dGTP diphosphatase
MASQKPLERPVLAVDVAVLRVEDGRLWVLLHRRREEPFPNALALPGVAVQVEETLREAAARALTDKASLARELLRDLHLEQLATFDALFRDPRGRTISVAYLGLVRSALGLDVSWHQVQDLLDGSLPFDHQQILETAVDRLRGKLRYTNIAAQILPPTFRIEQLQGVYEAVLGRSLNRANFRSKLLKLGLIEQTGILSEAVGQQGGRPPYLYRFVTMEVEAQDRDFL